MVPDDLAERFAIMPLWAGGEDKAEGGAGLRYRWPFRTGACEERLAGSEQPEDAA